DHDLRHLGSYLSARVPRGAPLFICRLKDEGLLFYYGRPTCRLATLSAFKDEPAYCLLTAAERTQWPVDQPLEEIAWVTDGQGDPVVLVRVVGTLRVPLWRDAAMPRWQ